MAEQVTLTPDRWAVDTLDGRHLGVVAKHPAYWWACWADNIATRRTVSSEHRTRDEAVAAVIAGAAALAASRVDQ